LVFFPFIPAIILDRVSLSTTSAILGNLVLVLSFQKTNNQNSMQFSDPIPVVDLFAGPGGLGEGFSSADNGNAFKIIVSVEMESAAHRTLKLRSFYRILNRQDSDTLESYYRFCNGEAETPWDKNNEWAWKEASKEARQITLGTKEGNAELTSILNVSEIDKAKPWVLIGGPPCQAYSLVGRARNKGKANYKAEDDHRHFLYKEYLQIIQKYQPAVFVMENVKGILTSKVQDQKIFHTILRDLADPDAACGLPKGTGYRIYSLVAPTYFERDMNPDEIDVHDFIIKSEEHGIPQARHRVILLGIRDDINIAPQLIEKSDPGSVWETIGDLPPLRSKISKAPDSLNDWQKLIKQHLDDLLLGVKARADLQELGHELRTIRSSLLQHIGFGALRLPIAHSDSSHINRLDSWFKDKRLKVWLNHEARSHMSTDLRRYLYVAAFARVYNRSPKGHAEFDLPGLRPDHKNWETGKFADRFKVQMGNRPATTVTSHISKDGHYYIHPIPQQCRSLTVREAARLQTFPDNYFFQGNRTQQYQQVGNAVPPFLAYKIAQKVLQILR
jgi:DNA (cytosine-5)-methyltransferase 1